MRGDTILKFIWTGVIDDPGKLCGAVMIHNGADRFPIQIQASEQEMHRLARALRETAREVRRRKRLREVA